MSAPEKHSNLKGFYHRALEAKGGNFLDDGKPLWNWHKWGDAPADADGVATRINALNKKVGATQEYAVVRCLGCGVYHNQLDWKGTHCTQCHWDIMNKIKPKPLLMMKPVLLKREEGDMWEIPATSSPLWTKQWAYQGSAKEPYIISKKKTTDGGTSADGWACSCRAFTQHSPRKECKHIINVKHQYGLGTVNPTKKAIANMDSDEAAAFAEFKRQQVVNAKQKPVSGDADLALFGAMGRKFR